MSLTYARPASVNPHARQPHILQPAGTTGLNANSQPVARQAVSLKSFLTRKPQN